MVDVMECKWRTGTKNGRVIYCQVGDKPDTEFDFMIGCFDEAEWAAEAVALHNAALEARNS